MTHVCAQCLRTGSLQQRCPGLEPRFLLEVHEAQRWRRGNSHVHTHTYRQAHTHTQRERERLGIGTQRYIHVPAREPAHIQVHGHTHAYRQTIIISPILLRALHCKHRVFRAQSLAVLSIVHVLSRSTRTCSLQTHTLPLPHSLSHSPRSFAPLCLVLSLPHSLTRSTRLSTHTLTH